MFILVICIRNRLAFAAREHADKSDQNLIRLFQILPRQTDRQSERELGSFLIDVFFSFQQQEHSFLDHSQCTCVVYVVDELFIVYSSSSPVDTIVILFDSCCSTSQCIFGNLFGPDSDLWQQRRPTISRHWVCSRAQTIRSRDARSSEQRSSYPSNIVWTAV